MHPQLFLASCLLGLTFCVADNVVAGENDIPGILRYVQRNENKNINRNNKLQNNERDRYSIELTRRTFWNEKEHKQLKKENRQLRIQLKEMKNLSVKDYSGEVSALKARLLEQKEAHKKSYEALAKKAESDRSQFAEEIIELKQQLAEQELAGKNNASVIQTLNNVKTKLISTEKENINLKSELTEMKTNMTRMPVVDIEQINSSEKKQNYAVGVMMGRDILLSLSANNLLGIKTDNKVLTAGLWDALNHQEKMNENVLQMSLSQAEHSIHKARQETAHKWKKAGYDWLKVFQKKKGVKQDKSGFWYLIEHGGDGEQISGDNTIVDVVVVEKLTDGTVIEDMDARGTVISQPLSDYPPLFRSALMLLRNHGTITVAAPSELTYGDSGYPPKIPPGATIVYIIRIENVKTSVISQK
ncbi:TPA: FKBP-type peptidyl-prolyl cis-trans isomerase N-terminal domain-containing protein [Escherichia coli]